MTQSYDRATDDVGNIVSLEHVNVCVPDQALATSFYISALGLTRDPYMMTGVDNMWANIGRSQFHLPSRGMHVLRGYTGLVMPWFDALPAKLEAARALLVDTQYAFTVHNSHIDVTCPWGNRIRVHEPSDRFGPMRLGMPYVEVDTPVGAVDGIVRFYNEIIHTSARAKEGEAHVSVGDGQTLIYKETLSLIHI